MSVPCTINGSENIRDQTPEIIAVINFYKAFNNQDLELMSINWHDSIHATMSNPLGGIKHGWNEIKSVYEKIFYGQAKVFVEFNDFELTESAEMFCITGRECGHLITENTTLQLHIRTSRIFILNDTNWKQIHHHGSIDNPGLLADYQRIILNSHNGQ